MHGYDNSNPDMKPTMLALGPDFKDNKQVDTLQSIEIYPMVCSMLKLTTCHGTDGTIDNSQEFVKSKANLATKLCCRTTKLI